MELDAANPLSCIHTSFLENVTPDYVDDKVLLKVQASYSGGTSVPSSSAEAGLSRWVVKPSEADAILWNRSSPRC